MFMTLQVQLISYELLCKEAPTSLSASSVLVDMGRPDLSLALSDLRLSHIFTGNMI